MGARKPARPYWLVEDDHDRRRRLVDALAHTVKVNRKKLFNHSVPEDVAIAALEWAEEDKPDPEQEGRYNARWRSPRGHLGVVYFIEVTPDGSKTLKIFDAYPLGREQY